MKRESASAAPRARRYWRRRLLVVLAVLAGCCAALPWLFPPERIADILLHRIGPGLQLKITRNGAAAWRLRGGPMLEVHALEISASRGDARWFEAERVLVAVPWRTVLSLGKHLDITRLELDEPILNVAALGHWLDRRVPADGAFPELTISDGAYLENGQVQGDGWQISSLSLQLPRFIPGTPVSGKLLGRYADPATQADFELHLAITRPALPAGAAVVGKVNLVRANTHFPAQFTLSAPLRLRHGQWHIQALSLALTGKLSRPATPPLPVAIHLSGVPAFGNPIALSPLTLKLSASGPLPALAASGGITLGEELSAHLKGDLPLWPDTWPALPAPLNQHARIGFTLDYTGAPDLSGLAQLELQRGPTRMNVRVHPAQFIQWFSRNPGSPLPPLQGHLSTPILELPGATLRGIVIESEP